MSNSGKNSVAVFNAESALYHVISSKKFREDIAFIKRAMNNGDDHARKIIQGIDGMSVEICHILNTIKQRNQIVKESQEDHKQRYTEILNDLQRIKKMKESILHLIYAEYGLNKRKKIKIFLDTLDCSQKRNKDKTNRLLKHDNS